MTIFVEMITMMKKITIILAFLMLCITINARKNKPAMYKIKTNYGVLKIKLYDETPLHKANFMKLVDQDFYNGLLFHRVIKSFMIQGGDPESRDCDSLKHLGDGDLDYRIPAEIQVNKFYHKRGALCAARQGDMVNPERESSACQFYIVSGKVYTDEKLDQLEQEIDMRVSSQSRFHFSDKQRLEYKTVGGTPHLDGTYTVFGELIEGFDVLDKISQVITGKNNRPKEDVVIIEIKKVRR